MKVEFVVPVLHFEKDFHSVSLSQSSDFNGSNTLCFVYRDRYQALVRGRMKVVQGSVPILTYLILTYLPGMIYFLTEDERPVSICLSSSPCPPTVCRQTR